LIPSTTYSWHVRSLNSFGDTYSNGSDTALWSFTTGDVPGAFSKTAPADQATGIPASITLSWTGSAGATTYEYCLDTSENNPCTNWVGNGEDTSVTLNELHPATTYYWQVRSANSFGSTYSDSSDTAMWSFTTGNLPGAFTKITPKNGATNLSTSLTLSWGASSGATGFEYCFYARNSNPCSNWAKVDPGGSILISGLSPKTAYYWHVRAVNSFGATYSEGSSTAFWSFTTFLIKLFLPILSR
jgi:cellulose 1,4-beta-cellobiosidase